MTFEKVFPLQPATELRTKTAINIGQGSLKPILPSQQGPLYFRRIHPKGEQVTFQPHPSLESLYVGCSWSLQPVLYSGLKSQDYEGLVLSDCKLLKSEMPSQESEIPGTDPTSSFNSTSSAKQISNITVHNCLISASKEAPECASMTEGEVETVMGTITHEQGNQRESPGE
ncbi:unnamed protein product [Caretta caretta]